MAASLAQEVAENAGLADHYYLSGVMETGSELLLRPDGTFDFYISYGAVDLTARGTWRRDGNGVLLTAAAPDANKPLFAYVNAEPWDAQVEQFYRGMLQEREIAAIRARCPSLAVPEVVVDTLAPPVEIEAAEPEPSVAAPRDSAPAEDCTLPPTRPVSDSPDNWARGLGIKIADLRSGSGARDVRVTFHLADGHEEVLTTDAEGLAFLMDRPHAPAVGISIEAPFAPGRVERLDLKPVGTGLIHISVDAEQLMRPAFSELRLRVADEALLPEGLEGGRYERQPNSAD